MAVPNSRRFVLEGSLPGGESFAASWAALGPVIAGGTAQDTADAVVANSAFTAFIAGAKQYCNGGTTYQRLRCYFYANDGTLADTGVADVANGAGSGATNLPNQCALVVSLRTATATRSGRGRMYLPGNGLGISTTTGKLTTLPSALATLAAALMDYTVGQVASETQGVVRPVTAVRVGNVIDTIRGRRQRLVENYATAVVP